MQVSSTILDELLAPGAAAFCQADLPDLRPAYPEYPYWSANLFLNQMFNAKYRAPRRQAVMNLMHRSTVVFDSYHRGRDYVQAYVSRSHPETPSISPYMRAISAWEECLFNLRIAFEMFNIAAEPDVSYVKGDGSVEERCALLNNRIKHYAEDITDRLADDLGPPVWMSDSGLKARSGSKMVEVGWEELVDLLRRLGDVANALQSPQIIAASSPSSPGA